MLLSDNDLVNVFTRHALDRLGSVAGRAEGLPLFAVEYDNPRPELPGQGRWSTIVTLQSLVSMVERTVFGPAKYLQDRRPPNAGGSWRTIPPLCASSSTCKRYFRRKSPTRRAGPSPGRTSRGGTSPAASSTTSTRPSWPGGEPACSTLLSEVAPYRAHHRTLRMLEASWTPSAPGVADALAREAALEGVGMYWTLRESVRADSVVVGPAGCRSGLADRPRSGRRVPQVTAPVPTSATSPKATSRPGRTGRTRSTRARRHRSGSRCSSEASRTRSTLVARRSWLSPGPSRKRSTSRSKGIWAGSTAGSSSAARKRPPRT